MGHWFSLKSADRRPVGSASVYLADKGNMVARTLTSARANSVGRVLLAAALLVFAATDPGSFGFQSEIDDLAAATYLLAAVSIGAFHWYSWWLYERTFIVAFAIDWVAFLFVPLEIEPNEAGYLICMFALAALLISEARIFWGTRIAFVTAFAVNVICFFLDDLGRFGHRDLTLDADFRRTLGLLLVSAFALRAGGTRTFRASRGVALARFPSFSVMQDEALRFAKFASGAAGAAVWFVPHRGNERISASTGSIEGWPTEDEPGSVPLLQGEIHRPLLFKRSRHIGMELQDDGRFRLRTLSKPQEDALASCGVNDGFAMNLNCVTGVGVILLSDLPDPSREALVQAEWIGQEVGRGIDSHRYEQAVHGSVLMGVQQSFARDLHDGVAQSLAGTQQWLRSLRRQVKGMEEAETSVDRMLSAISAEYEHVRTLIDRLRNTVPESDEQELDVLLRELVSNLSAQWQRAIVLRDGVESLRIPRSLSFEIEQIVREVVSNSVQHGEADHIDLRYTHSGETLELIATDDGRGFPAGKQASVPRSLRERMEALQGQVELQSEPGSTRLIFRIPMRKNP